MSPLRILRLAWPGLVLAACLGFAILAFDWRTVGRGLATMDLPRTIALSGAFALAAMVARSIRWVAVAGLPFRWRPMIEAHCYVAVAIAAATATPMQIGEAIKLHFARSASGLLLARSTLAFAMERVADMVAVLTLLAIGLAAHGLGAGAAVAAAVVGLGGLRAMPVVARRLAVAGWLPGAVSAFLAPLLETRLSQGRFAVLIACTAAKWGCVLGMWAVPLHAAGAPIGPADMALLVAGVTLAGVLSLVPGAIGVAEISTRAILVWMGVDAGAAETAAIALRLLTLVILAIGLAHGLPMLLARRAAARGAAGVPR